MLLLIKKLIRKGVKIQRDFDVDALEITLDKNYFGLDRSMNIIFTYASPINSCYTTARPENILDKIGTKLVDGRNTCLVMGDLNGRTKTEEDFVRDSSDEHSPINIPFYTKDNEMERKNQDLHTIDNQGKLILDLCKTNSLRILNGRINGDTNGKFTRYPKRCNEKPSVIDYALCGEALIPQIFSFSVLPFTELSDHCCISTNIKINAPQTSVTPEVPKIKVHPNNVKLGYDKGKKHVFQANILLSDKLDPLLSTLNKPVKTESDLHTCIRHLNEVILDAAKRSFRGKNMASSKPRGRKQKTKAWFNKECAKLRKNLRRHSRDLSTSPFDRQKLYLYNKAKMKYKRACRKAEKQCRKILKEKLLEIGVNDPKNFWSIINKMNNWGKEHTEETEHIKPATWNEYFKKLLNKPKTSDTPNSSLTPTFDPTLDGIISAKELRDALNQMKNNKAPGPDGVLIEYLKAFGETFEGILLKIIRQLFSRNVYPSEWNSNYLKPIHKKGDLEDPDNYRGLAVGSALAKLFSLILLNRLLNHINEKGLISHNQIGFMKGARTSDHIFLLQTVIEKVVKKNKNKLYTAFIDFSKAYDTVDRKKLFERLQSLGINGIFLKNIMAMYEKTSYKIKLKNGYLDPISSNLGLKQGCPLSPILFNLYIDDIKNLFDKECDPVTLQHDDLYHFLYADDLVLLSTSTQGLQRSLDKLAAYADLKCLTISIKKSKTMTFNLSGRLEKKEFNIKGKALEPVNSFCYLGFEICPSGTVKHAMNTLHDKAKKALRPLMGAIAKFDLPTKTAIKLFHTYVSPIILYNVENWGVLTGKNLKDYNEMHFFNATDVSNTDILHRKYLKYVLGLSKSSPNLAVYGETGEIPLSLKGYRLMLNYWKRLTTLPDQCLAKKALMENVNIRTNWILTIEKLVRTFKLIEVPEKKFKKTAKYNIEEYYKNAWKNKITNEDIPRLEVYKLINSEFTTAKHLELSFPIRKIISKIRCSNHPLEIEKGRHSKTPREERFCKNCQDGTVETESHFLLNCSTYQPLRDLFNMQANNTIDFLHTENQMQLGMFLLSAFKLRERLIYGRVGG